jgi:hypothetical protein
MFTIALLILLLALATTAFAQSAQPGKLDFLKSRDSSFALFSNTSFGATSTNRYQDELLLITGLPFSPEISARIDLLGSAKPSCCGGLRNVVLSPDGDTALVASDPQDNFPSALFLLRNVRAFARSKKAEDLRVRAFSEKDVPQLHTVAGLAFGSDGPGYELKPRLASS